jgi:hypothetical protein
VPVAAASDELFWLRNGHGMNSLPVFYCPQILRPQIQAAAHFYF